MLPQILLVIAGVAIAMIILQAAISYATKTKERQKIEEASFYLLSEIALKLGVDDKVVEKAKSHSGIPFGIGKE